MASALSSTAAYHSFVFVIAALARGLGKRRHNENILWSVCVIIGGIIGDYRRCRRWLFYRCRGFGVAVGVGDDVLGDVQPATNSEATIISTRRVNNFFIILVAFFDFLTF